MISGGVARQPDPEHRVVAVVVAGHDLAGQPARLGRRVGRADRQLLGPDQHRHRARRQARAARPGQRQLARTPCARARSAPPASSWPSSRLASPMKPASSGSAGLTYRSCGAAYCAIWPSRSTRDAVGHGQRLVLVVGDQDRGRAARPEDLLHVGPDAGPQVRVQGRERLVQQHQRPARWPAPGPARRAAAGRRTAGAGTAGPGPPARPSPAASPMRGPRRWPAGSPKPTLAATDRCGNRLPSCGT